MVWSKWIKNKGMQPVGDDQPVVVKLSNTKHVRSLAGCFDWELKGSDIYPIEKYKVELDFLWYKNLGKKPNKLKKFWYVEVELESGGSYTSAVCAIDWENTERHSKVVRWKFAYKKPPSTDVPLSEEESEETPENTVIDANYGKTHFVL